MFVHALSAACPRPALQKLAFLMVVSGIVGAGHPARPERYRKRVHEAMVIQRLRDFQIKAAESERAQQASESVESGEG